MTFNFQHFGKFQKYLCSYFGFCSFLFLLFCSPTVQADSGEFSGLQDIPSEKNLYQRIYQELSIDGEKRALTNMADDLDISISKLTKLLENPDINSADFQDVEFCKNTTAEQQLLCWKILRELFTQELELQKYVFETQEAILSQNRWANGTLADGSFDIVVDLNVIDVILFGPNADIPVPLTTEGFLNDSREGRVRRYAEPVDPLNNPSSVLSTTHDNTDNQSEDDVSGEDDNDTDTVDQNSDEGDDESSDKPLMCRDPEALFLSFDTGRNNSVRSGVSENNQSESAEDKQQLAYEGTDPEAETNTNSNTSSENTDDIPEDISEQEPESEGGCAANEVSLYDGLICVPQFCDDLICVFIQSTPGRTFTLSPIDTPRCIECVVQKGYEVASMLDSTVETPQISSNESWVVSNVRSAVTKVGFDFYAIPRALPFLKYSDPAAKKTSSTDNKSLNVLPKQELEQGTGQTQSRAEKKGKQKFTTVAELSANILPTENNAENTNNSLNYELAQLSLQSNCPLTITLKKSPEAEITLDELYDDCLLEHRTRYKKTIGQFLNTHQEKQDFIDFLTAVERGKERTAEIQAGLRILAGDIRSFTGIISAFSGAVNTLASEVKKHCTCE